MGFYILMGAIMLASWLVGWQLKRKFEKYSNIHLSNGMSGAEIATKMLHDHGIYNVKVISTPGRLTDHYNPMDKTVNLSEAVYNQRNAAAAAVAAHEVGHAVQHATAYSWLTMRSKLVPIVNVASSMVTWVLLLVVTLPVEYDASNRALKWLKAKNMVNQKEYAGAKDSLNWAARTYLVAALSSIGTLLYYLMIYLGRRE